MYNSYLKLQRAKEHIRALDVEVKSFIGTKPYLIKKEVEKKTGDLVFRLKIVSQIPDKWGTNIGDIIHNLRASLDLLITDLLLVNGNEPTEESGFPIYNKKRDFTKNYKRKIKGIGREATGLLRELKPYKRGNRKLWQLHSLDIVDKHRLIIPIGSSHKGLTIDSSQSLKQFGPIPSLPITIKPRRFLLSNGKILFKVKKGDWEGGYGNPKFDFELAFGEKEIMRGESLSQSINEFTKLVESIIENFRPLLVKQ